MLESVSTWAVPLAAAVFGGVSGALLQQSFKRGDELKEARSEWAELALASRREALHRATEPRTTPVDWDPIPKPHTRLQLLDPVGARFAHAWITGHTRAHVTEFEEDIRLGTEQGLPSIALGSKRTNRVEGRIETAFSLWCRRSVRRPSVWFRIAVLLNQRHFDAWQRSHQGHGAYRPGRRGRPPEAVG